MAPTDTPAVAGLGRSNNFTSNVTTGDLFSTLQEDVQLTIAGTDRRNHVEWESLTITQGITDEPATLTATIIPRGGFTVSAGHDIQVWISGVDVGIPLFGGTILQTQEVIGRHSDPLDIVVQATDYRWLINRFARVNASYRSQGINTAVRNILDTFTDPNSGFVMGYVPSSIGDVEEVTFNNVTVTEALSTLAGLVDGGGFYSICRCQGGDKRVSLYDEPDDEGNTISVLDGGAWRNLVIDRDLSQAKNRVNVTGGGSKTTERVAANATAIPVEETRAFDQNGGDARAGRLDVSYTALTTASGPGSLAGVTGVSADIPQGADVFTFKQENDAAAQTTMATLLGSSQSGITIHEVSDSGLQDDDVARRAASLLDELSTPNIEVKYDIAPTPLNSADTYPGSEGVNQIRPGRQLTVNITSPITLNDTFRVRNVTLSFRSRRNNGEPVFNRNVHADLVVQRSNEPLGLQKRLLGNE